MALATLSDSLPGTLSDSLPGTLSDSLPGTRAGTGTGATPAADPGLSARMASLRADLAGLLADLDPGLLLGRDAADLYRDFAGLERLVVAGKTLLAPRIAASGQWELDGHRSPAGLLATLEGGSRGAARRTLESGRRLADLPDTEAALRRGTLSGPKLDEITQAASVDPAAEAALLAGSGDQPLSVVKERCARVRATSANRDPMATYRRIHAGRSFASWTDAEGAFCFQGRDTAERGAALLARLVPVANRLRSDRRAAATEVESTGAPGAPPPDRRPEPEAALRADAWFALLCGSTFPATDDPTGATNPTGATPTTGRARTSAATNRTDPPDPDLVATVPPATVMVRVDLAALRRGRALPGELSAIDGLGPVPVPVVSHLLDDAVVALVVTEAEDITKVVHFGRTINATLRTGLAFRDRGCVVPGCGVPYGLEIDHVVPLEAGGATRLDNLALLCRFHHRMKTYDGWVLERTGPSDAHPGWTFTPQPPFGQEPGLGMDRPPDPVPRT
jgi:hypothetical protein